MAARAPDAAPLPSAFEVIAQLRGQDGAHRPTVFLDYDGTLTPIVQRPELAILDPDVRASVRRLAAVADVAIVSGRDLEDLLERVALDGVTVAGSHGFEARFADGHRETFASAESYLEPLHDAATELDRRIGAIDGARIERKRFALATHYREVAPDRQAEVTAAALAVAADYPTLRPGHGKMVLELRPNVDWHKGRFVTAYLERRDRSDHSPVAYLGDDVTDEDGFEAVQRLHPPGASILVGAAEGRATAAGFTLPDTAAAHEWLIQLTRALRG